MLVSLDASSFKRTKWSEYALRFAIGGIMTAAAGLVGKHFGPGIGGLFLAFPAIFPASVTLIAKHEQQKKAQKGLHGERRGKEAAAVDAAGTVLGGLGLMLFAGVTWWLLPSGSPALVLAAGTGAWILGSSLLWLLRKRRHRRP